MTATRLLRVTTSYFVAGVVYEKWNGKWRPVRAAPILAWVMAHDSAEQMGTFLKGPGRRKGWTWEWVT